MKLFEDLLEKSAKLADQATKVAGEVFEQSKAAAGEAMDKGKKKMEELGLEADLSKAQKQLGALVYVMHKTGEKNDELLEQYISEIAAIEEKLEALRAEEPEEEAAEDFSLEDIEKAANDLASAAEEEMPEIKVEEPRAEDKPADEPVEG